MPKDIEFNKTYYELGQEKAEQVNFDSKSHRGKEVEIDAMFFAGTEESVRIIGDDL